MMGPRRNDELRNFAHVTAPPDRAGVLLVANFTWAHEIGSARFRTLLEGCLRGKTGEQPTHPERKSHFLGGLAQTSHTLVAN